MNNSIKNIGLLILASVLSPSVFAQVSSDTQKPYVLLACEPKTASDEQYNIDLVVDGALLKLLIHVPLLGQDRPEYFEMEAVNRRSSDMTTIRGTTTPQLMLVVAKKGRLNANGEPTFSGVFRGGGEYGIYSVNCVKKDPPPVPQKAKTPQTPAPSDGASTPAEPTPPADSSGAGSSEQVDP